MARWIAVLVLLGLVVAVAPPGRPAPAGHPTALTPAALLPPIFRPVTVGAQGALPVTTGCKGTPIPADPLLGGQNGQLSITMNSLSLLTAANVEAQIVTSPKVLDFAKSAGVFGTFAQNVVITPATYTQIKGVVSATLTVFCGVRVGTGSNSGCTIGGAAQTWVTKGGTALTSPDCLSGSSGCTAAASQITTSAGNQSFTMNLPTPLVVSSGSAKQANMFFNNDAACELWDISSLLSHVAGTDYKIVPGSQAPSQVQVP